MNLRQILSDSAARDGSHVAIKLDDVELSYAMLDGAAAHIAGLLKARGVGAGDRVALMIPNVPYFAVCYYGILRAGAIVVPMNVLNKRREVSFYLRDSGAKSGVRLARLSRRGAAGRARTPVASASPSRPGEFEQLVGAADPVVEIVERDESDTAVILYTSGTTGTPKGAELTHANLLRNCRLAGALFDLGADGRGARSAAAVSLLRPDLRDERDDRGRRHADADPAVRPGQGARDHRARPGQRVRRRADDVRSDAARTRTRAA